VANFVLSDDEGYPGKKWKKYLILGDVGDLYSVRVDFFIMFLAQIL